MSEDDFSYAKQIEYMDELILELMQSDKSINEILDMPFHYVVEMLKERNKPMKEQSLIAAFGG